MNLPEVTFEWYAYEYGGQLGEDAFRASLPHAKAAVREIIGFNVAETDEQIAALRNAVCAAAEVDALFGGTGGAGVDSSFTIGSFSMGGSGAGSRQTQDSGYKEDMRRAIRGELVATGLLCQVIL